MDNLKARGAKALLWDFSGKIAQHGMAFVVSIFLARLLEPSEFGLVAMVTVIIAMAQVFTDVGLGGALVQRRRVLPVHYSSVFYFNIAVASGLSLLTFFSASLIGDFYDNPQLVPLAQVMSLLFVFGAFPSVQNAKLRKELNYALMTKTQLRASFVSGIVGISLAFYGAGVWSLVAQSITQGFAYNILIWNVAGWKPSPLFSLKALMQLWGYGFRMFLSALIDSVFTRLDYLIIGKLFMPATLGFFQRAKSLNLMVVSFSSESLMSVLFPVLSRVQNDLPRFQNIVVKALGVISFIAFLLLGILFLTAEEIIVLLFGVKWLPAAYFFKILALSGFAYPVSALLVNVLSSRGNSKMFLRLEIYKKIIAALNLAILYFWGIDAYLYGLIMQAVLGVSLNIHFAAREIQFSFSLFIKPLMVQASIAIISALGTMEVLSAVQIESRATVLAVTALLYGMWYIGLNHIFGTDSYAYVREELQQLIARKKNQNVKSTHDQ